MSKEGKIKYIKNVNKALGGGTDKMTGEEYLEALEVLSDEIEARIIAAQQDVELDGHAPA